MTVQTILMLSSIGIFAGVLSGFVGVGGGIIIVPGLVFLLGLTQHEAQGTSLFVLAIAFSNSKSPLLRTPLTIKFALTFLQKSIVRPS